MPPSLALFLWLISVAALLWFDPARDSKTSVALWVPVIWMFILGSKLPSQWLGGERSITAAALEEGNPLDRSISLLLILLSVGVLLSRSFRWSSLFSYNRALTAFLFFGMVSAFWSDFPLIAFRRWLRDFGNYLVILVVLSDPRPLEGIRTLLRRVSYLLIPLSVLLVKYYPNIGKSWDAWTGIAEYCGATTGKNMLGVACLVSGLFFFWDTATRWPHRKKRQTKQIIVVNLVFIAMTVWLLNLSNSATSRTCLVVGCLVIAAAHSQRVRRKPALLTVLIPVVIFVCLLMEFGLGIDIKGAVAEVVGRDPTLTDRTKIWSFLLAMKTNPLLGTGYESFWLGPRLQWFWQNSELGHINEAHNGFLEVYLNLGVLGLFSLLSFLIASYRTICKRLTLSSLGPLMLALWTVIIFFSITEAGFRNGLMWVTFLLAAINIPEPRAHQAIKVATLLGTKTRELPVSVPLGDTPACLTIHSPVQK